jgi:hypothetical protein
MGFFGDIGDFFGDAAKIGANFTIGAPLVLARRLGLLGGDDAAAGPPLIPPPLPPDATDEQIRQAVLFQRRRLLLGQGMASTFLSGPLGDPSAVATTKSSAGGF